MPLEWSSSPQLALNVNGAKLEYACFGPVPENGTTIVMLHEGLGCLSLWRDFPQRVSEATGLGVLVFSRQGYGQSDPVSLPRPLDFMTREALDVLPGVLEQVGIRRCILFGHSDGATIAAIYAGSVEDHRVRGLILMAPHFFTEETGLQEIARAKQSYAETELRQKMAKYHADPDGAFRGWNEVWLHPNFKDWNVAEVIDYLRIPVLAIQGRDDQYGTLAQIEEIETRAYSPVDTVILDCRHAPHLEAPSETLAAIREFAARLERIEAAEVIPA
ncbi:alpha/beta fold hydrolase [Primorskyibacter sp. S87]|uniref:alpha/beta fold hydrolase n=1 Tax=Primorskyibacter sp. S87 TaxID=3415126 RepID=UPI003C7D1A66